MGSRGGGGVKGKIEKNDADSKHIGMEKMRARRGRTERVERPGECENTGCIARDKPTRAGGGEREQAVEWNIARKMREPEVKWKGGKWRRAFGISKFERQNLHYS